MRQQAIELPSWAFGNSGTRFKVFAQEGVPRDPFEKMADAAEVNRYTGVAPTVSLHIPWDAVDDYRKLAQHAADLGVGIGAINSNVFQDNDYMLGSVTNPDPRVRRKATDHLLACVDIMDATGSRDLKLWFSDGTNYPGQDDIAARQDRLAESLAEVYARLGPDQRFLLEYKFFEPAFYTMDVPDWGTAYAHCMALGPKAQVVVDTGHHAPGTNIEFIVALLLRAGKLGGFDFNSRFYADDDLMVGSADPFQLFRILYEVRQGNGFDPAVGVAFMLDQCHNIEPKIPAQIRSVMNVQEATAKALLVDADALAKAQADGDVLGANAVAHGRLQHRCAATDRRAARRSRPRPGPGRRLRPFGLRREDQGRPRRWRGRRLGRVSMTDVVEQLIARSNRLGADPRNTNYAGGNTSAKGTETDPVTGEPVELLWVKGSGGDLGTLTESGLAVLRLDRLRALVDVYPGVDREDEMVAAFDYCLHGRGGAAPSIDTATHALVEAPHVDHLHPDSGIALATAADGEALTQECFGSRVAWVPWRRPGFQLGLDTEAVRAENPDAIGVILGGHGITAWGATSAEAEANSLEIIATATRFIAERGRPEPVRGCRAGLRAAARGRAPRQGRGAGAGDPRAGVRPTGRRSATSPTPTSSWTSCPASGSPHWRHWARRARTTSCAPRSGRWSSTCRPAPRSRRRSPACGSCTRPTARTTPPTTRGTRRADSPAMRGADPAIVLVPGVGMFSFGTNKQTARVAGEFYVNAINVMRGAEALSTYAPIDEGEKFRIEYWSLEEAKLARLPKPKPLADARRAGHRRRLGHRPGHRVPARRRRRLRRRRRPRRRRPRRSPPRSRSGPRLCSLATLPSR